MQIQEVNPVAAQESHPTEAFTLQFASSLREQAEAICDKEGITLNHFINTAIKDRIAHDAHTEWLKRRKVPTDAELQEVREMLRRPSSRPPDPGDELPEGYKRPL